MGIDLIYKGLSNISGMLEFTISKVSQSFDLDNPLPGRNIDQILHNPVDKRKVDAAVERLKEGKEKSEDITLSDNEHLTISIF